MWGIDDFSAISWSANNPRYPLLGFAPRLSLYRFCALFLKVVGAETQRFIALALLRTRF